MNDHGLDPRRWLEVPTMTKYFVLLVSLYILKVDFLILNTFNLTVLYYDIWMYAKYVYFDLYVV